MEKIVVHYGLFNDGAGAAYIRWYLTEEEAENAEEAQDEGWGEPCNGSVETFVGSDIHQKAIKNGLNK